MNENELKELGIFRIPIPIPFPQAGGPVNACVIEEENGLLLFDPGIGTAQGVSALAEGLSKSGHSLPEIKRIVLSHGHIDHFGAAGWIMEQSGREIPVYVHENDADKVLQSGPDWPTLIRKNSGRLQQLGVPADVLEQAAVNLSRNSGLGNRLRTVLPLIPGEIFNCRHVNLEVLHMPGHTPGLSCLYDRGHKLLFSGDHLLERVSPNPLMDLRADGAVSAFRPLITYFESLQKVRALPIDLVVPGHAAPFTNYLEVIDSLHQFYARRQERILDILNRGPMSVYEVMQELFIGGDGFELILMISETLGNLEMLETEDKVTRDTDGNLIRFQVR